jgi:predicted DCC family thiol-disulfide oxidoreductase YuxK
MSIVRKKEDVIQPCLIYDAECRLCVASKKMLQYWDKKKRIQFVPASYLTEMVFLTGRLVISSPGTTWPGRSPEAQESGVMAFRALLPFLPMGKILALFFLLPGMHNVAVFIYRIIAKNRYRWFGAVEE